MATEENKNLPPPAYGIGQPVNVTAQPQPQYNPPQAQHNPIFMNQYPLFMNQYQPQMVNATTWVNPHNIQPGISMPNPVPGLGPGIPFSIPENRLVSIDSLNQPINPVNAESALNYLMSNEQDLCVILTQYDRQAGCCESGDTFEAPEKLIAGSVQTPLYDITSWESTKRGKIQNYIGFREKKHVASTDQELAKLKDSKAPLFLSHFCGFAYKSEKEALHWNKYKTFNCTYMDEGQTNFQMVESFRKMWDKAHNLDFADSIIKNTDLDANGIRAGWDLNNKDLLVKKESNVIGRALIVPFEFSQTHKKRRKVTKTKNSRRVTYHMDHWATYNLELRIYQCQEDGKPVQIQYRVRAVLPFPNAEQQYQEIQPENEETKPEDMKGTGEVYFAILDGLIDQPVGEHSVLGSVVMQSGSNKMVIKFPQEANEDDRIRLFSSLVMLENFMRSRSDRAGACCRCNLCTIL